MMDNFTQILWLSTTTEVPSTSNHFEGVTPFKVQVNFDFHLFEGEIDVNALDKWLSLLEGYFFVHKFSNREKVTFALLKVIPYVKYWWDTYYKKHATKKSGMFGANTTWENFVIPSKRNTTPLETMMTIT